ncbi:MAG: hypothetical protein IJE66_07535 [Akkermansia sp.]|nr:hypothetical protein [Akkermansia sp.]
MTIRCINSLNWAVEEMIVLLETAVSERRVGAVVVQAEKSRVTNEQNKNCRNMGACYRILNAIASFFPFFEHFSRKICL